MRPATVRWLLAHTNVADVLAARGRDAPREVFTDLLAALSIQGSASGTSGDRRAGARESSSVQELRTVAEVALLAGITERAVRQAVARGRLKAQIVLGRQAFEAHDLHAWLSTKGQHR